MAAVAPGSRPTRHLQVCFGADAGAVLACELHIGLLRLDTESLAVDQQAFCPSGEIELYFGYRHVGDGFKDRAEAAIYAVDATRRLDIDLSSQIEGDIGQLMFGGAQVHGARQRLIQKGTCYLRFPDR